MKLRRYCVTVMDNWTPTQEFWTYAGAIDHAMKFRSGTAIWKWNNRVWQRLL